MKKREKWKTVKGDVSAYGLDDTQLQFLFSLVAKALDTIDPREQHFMLLVLTREDSDEERDVVSSDMISSMDRTFMHESLRQWLHKETQ